MHPQTKWRQKTGVSQQRLSRATGPTRKEIKEGAKGPLGVDQGLLSKLEKGDHLPGLETAARLCIAMAKLSPIVAPLRLTHYLPRELAITYSQTMEAHANGLAQGTTAQAADRGGDESKRRYAKKTAQEAVSITDQRTRTGSKSGRKRAATKAAKAGKKASVTQRRNWRWSEEESRYYRKPKR